MPEPSGVSQRQQQAQWRREQLLDVAMSVFGTRGLELASTREVAAAAGVTPGLLYHYFPSKEALALAVIAERSLLPELRSLLAATAGQPAAAVIPRFMSECAVLVAERAPLFGLFISGATSNPRIRQELHNVIAEGQGLIAGYLTAAVARGELRDHDSAAVAHLMIAPVVLGQIVGVPGHADAIGALLVDHLAQHGTVGDRPEP
ncbi:TetR/AcrR family transcriptional regulator [Kribbella sp. NBC_01505]|uniref:TetR/AcrR family transcriptional regulator n=1 Tax=Kribbella sp. NBC_01505 TaxID=2903580 RepID=UPI003868DA04